VILQPLSNYQEFSIRPRFAVNANQHPELRDLRIRNTIACRRKILQIPSRRTWWSLPFPAVTNYVVGGTVTAAAGAGAASLLQQCFACGGVHARLRVCSEGHVGRKCSNNSVHYQLDGRGPETGCAIDHRAPTLTVHQSTDDREKRSAAATIPLKRQHESYAHFEQHQCQPNFEMAVAFTDNLSCRACRSDSWQFG